MERVRKAEVLAPSKFNRRVPQELDRVVLKALARDVQDRYQNAAELGEDLQKFLAPYRFDPRELVEYVRGLFRTDYTREVEEVAACQRAVLDEGEAGRSGSLVVPAAALAAAMPSGGTPLTRNSGAHAVVQAVSKEETTAPVSIPASASEEMPVPATQTGVEGLAEGTGTGPGNPAKQSGLWARLRGRFSR